MSRPKFSIVIPTFNAATTLQACLDSIVGQTYADYELVLVDGGSTDKTVDLANNLASRLGPRLVIHSEPRTASSFSSV